MNLGRISSAFTGVFQKFQSHSEAEESKPSDRRPEPTNYSRVLDDKLKFHHVHGKEVTLSKNDSVAERNNEVFQNSVVFSNRPVRRNEVVAVKITKAGGNRFCGPLKIGFTSINPTKYLGKKVPIGLELLQKPEVWLRAILTHEIRVGCTVHFVRSSEGAIFHAVDGTELGMLMLEQVDTSKPLWAILEVYGAVERFQLVDRQHSFTFNKSPFARRKNVKVDENGNTVKAPSSEKDKLAERSIAAVVHRKGVPYSQLQLGKRNGIESHQLKVNSPGLSPSAPPLTPQSPHSATYYTPMSSPSELLGQ